MKKIFLFLSVLCISIACSKLELPETPTDSDKTNDNTDASRPGNNDDETIYTVNELISKAEANEEVTLDCYIVGYVPNSSISKTVFGVEDAVASNIVVADAPTECDYTKCAAVQLIKGRDVRKDLNLQDNPNRLGQHILLQGTVKEYMRSKGIINVVYYEIKDNDNDVPPVDDNKNELSKWNFPTISNQSPSVFEGD